ncbi:hypothetical protein ACFVVX_32425 [Kitasatospora sp. NPDC058170]|uniref:hypothetical protein n=1 Tax=Kitasatospora sp. NPDC058170 TaxID=3346364 RepID=UPI0036D88E4D
MTAGPPDDRYPRHRAAQAVRIVAWLASLMPPDLRDRALLELGDAALDTTVDQLPWPGRSRHRARPADGRPGDPGHRIDELRAARTVLECDALLAAAPAPWPALAAAHRRQPFEPAQRRALIARRDCPDEFTAALLTPWDPRVANRLVARQQELPDWSWRPGLLRIGELRPALLRHVLTGENAADVLSATPRLDLLVRIVDGTDRNHNAQVRVFWTALGTALRAELGPDRQAWLTAATRLPGHRGSLRGLLRGLGRPTAQVLDGDALPDLRVLAQAPAEILGDILARLTDAELNRMAERPLRRLWTAPCLTELVLGRLHGAGVPPRAPFADWARGTYLRTTTTLAWLYGLDEGLDRSTDREAHYDLGLRRLLALRRPPRRPAADPVAELRRCDGPVEAQAVLDGTYGPAGPPPWPELLRAHATAPLPESVLCVLADRTGFPDALAGALPFERLSRLAAHAPATARAVLAQLAETSTSSYLIDRIRRVGVLDDRAVLAAARPAQEALRYVHSLPVETASRDAWTAVCAESVARAAAGAGPGFWSALAERLPGFDGPLPRLLEAVTDPA